MVQTRSAVPDSRNVRWRVELHLDGLPTDGQQFALMARENVSITGDTAAQLCVVTYLADAVVPTIPLMNAMSILLGTVPHLNVNAVQITKTMSEKEAVAWVNKQFKSMNVSWKSSQDF